MTDENDDAQMDGMMERRVPGGTILPAWCTNNFVKTVSPQYMYRQKTRRPLLLSDVPQTLVEQQLNYSTETFMHERLLTLLIYTEHIDCRFSFLFSPCAKRYAKATGGLMRFFFST